MVACSWALSKWRLGVELVGTVLLPLQTLISPRSLPKPVQSWHSGPARPMPYPALELGRSPQNKGICSLTTCRAPAYLMGIPAKLLVQVRVAPGGAFRPRTGKGGDFLHCTCPLLGLNCPSPPSNIPSASFPPSSYAVTCSSSHQAGFSASRMAQAFLPARLLKINPNVLHSVFVTACSIVALPVPVSAHIRIVLLVIISPGLQSVRAELPKGSDVMLKATVILKLYTREKKYCRRKVEEIYSTPCSV